MSGIRPDTWFDLPNIQLDTENSRISGQIEEITTSLHKFSKNFFLKPLPVLLWCKKCYVLSTVREKSLQYIYRESFSQTRRVLYLSLFCVNQWEEEKYFILLRYWLKSKGTVTYWYAYETGHWGFFISYFSGHLNVEVIARCVFGYPSFRLAWYPASRIFGQPGSGSACIRIYFESWILIRIHDKSWIRIRIKSMRIRNTAGTAKCPNPKFNINFRKEVLIQAFCSCCQVLIPVR
jgi:hypothetical protein